MMTSVLQLKKILGIWWLFSALLVSYGQLEKFDLLYLDMYPRELSVFRVLLSLSILTGLSCILPNAPKTCSGYFLWLHLIFPIVPSLVGFSYSGLSSIFIAVLVGAFCLLRLLCSRFASVKIPLNWGVPRALEVIWILAVILCALTWLSGDYQGLEFTFGKVYENREFIAEHQSGSFAYCHFILAKSLLPFLLVLCFIRKQRLLFVCALGLSVGMYFLTQHRATLFFPFLTLLGYQAFIRSSVSTGGAITGYFAATVTVLCFLIEWEDVRLWVDLLTRRTFIAPALLNYEYFEYFSSHAHTWFSDSKVSLGLLNRVYDQQVPYMISEHLGRPGGHANASYIGSGFQQAGFLGMLVYLLIISVSLRVLDAFGDRVRNHPFVMASCLPSLFWLINSSDLPGVFLTHGLLCSMAILLASHQQLSTLFNVNETYGNESRHRSRRRARLVRADPQRAFPL